VAPHGRHHHNRHEGVDNHLNGAEAMSPSTSEEEEVASSEEDLAKAEMEHRYHRLVHRLPLQPTPCDYLLFFPKAIIMFFYRLNDAFGYKVSRKAGRQASRDFVVRRLAFFCGFYGSLWRW